MYEDDVGSPRQLFFGSDVSRKVQGCWIGIVNSQKVRHQVVVLSHGLLIKTRRLVFQRIEKEKYRVHRQGRNKGVRGKVRLTPPERVPGPLPVDAKSIQNQSHANSGHLRPSRKGVDIFPWLSIRKPVHQPPKTNREEDEYKNSRDDGIGLPYKLEGNLGGQNMFNGACIETVVEISVMRKINKVRQDEESRHGDKVNQPNPFRDGGTDKVQARNPR